MPALRRRTDPLTPLLGAVSLVVFWLHGFSSYLSRDLALYTYAGQHVLDGVPPYVAVLNRAGPLAHLLPAVGIAAGRAVGQSDVLGARVFYLLLAVVCVCLVHVVGRDVFGSRLAGLVSATAFLTFLGFIEYAADGPREKTPMVLFGLCSLWALAHRRWGWAGLFLGLATLTLQLAFFVGAPVLVVCLAFAPRKARALALAVGGGAVPVLVLAAYFAWQGALGAAVDGFLLLNLRDTSANPMLPHLAYDWSLLVTGYGVSLYVLLGGLLAWLVLSPAALVGVRRDASAGAALRVGLGLSAVAGVLWTLHDFDSWPDVFELLPVAALGVGGAFAAVRSRVRLRAASLALALAWALAATAFAGVSSVTRRDHRLEAQRSAVAAALDVLPHARMASLNAPQPLVLAGRTNPSRYQMFLSGLDRYVSETWPGGLPGFTESLLRDHPQLVAVGTPSRAWMRRALRPDYTVVGAPPGWVWYAARSLGPDTLDRLRAGQPQLPPDGGAR